MRHLHVWNGKNELQLRFLTGYFNYGNLIFEYTVYNNQENFLSILDYHKKFKELDCKKNDAI